MSKAGERQIVDLIEGWLSRLIEVRHDLHRHPQMAYQETYASERIQQWLTRLGIAFEAGLAKTGVVGWIEPTDEAARRRPAVGLRADIDALPITERTGAAYTSENEGLMHACGHDGHTTILLGAAAVLAELRDELVQPVKLVFQPAEEGAAGGKKLTEAGVLEATVGGHAIERIFGLHGWPQLPLGRVGVRTGTLMASTDDFRITVRGRGSHGATPHLGADPIVTGAALVSGLQTIVSRNVEPTRPAVISVGRFNAGQANNIIPDTAQLTGTIRAVDGQTAALLHRRLRELAKGTAVAMGCEAVVEIRIGYPPLVNDAECVQRVMEAAKHVGGAKVAAEAGTGTTEGAAGTGVVARAEAAGTGVGVVVMDQPVMTAEDFAFYAQRIPGAFFLLGLCPAGRKQWPGLHTGQFDFNDEAIGPGVRMMCELALGGNES